MYINTLTITIILTSAISTILIVCYGMYSLKISNQSIFVGSGKPDKMATMVLESIYIMAKNLVGVFIITTILILISEKILGTDQGLPVVSLVIGYLLGKDFVTTKNATVTNKNDS